MVDIIYTFKKFNLFVALVVAVVLFSNSVFVLAETPREKAKRAKNQVNSIRRELDQAVADYQSALGKLYRINSEISKTQKELKKAIAQLIRNQAILNQRAEQIYRNDKISLLEVVLGAKDFDEFLTRFDFLKRVGKQDAQVLNRVKRLKAEIEKKRDRLLKEKEIQSRLVNTLESKKSEIERELSRQKALLSRFQKEIAALDSRPKPSYVFKPVSTPIYTPRISLNGFVFPVEPPYSYSNDWLAPRSGGRLHQGNDIMAPMGAKIYAVVSGSVSAKEGGMSGKMIILNGNDGNVYYYIHLSGFAVTSGSVSAGQVIGYNGNTGNAAGGPPHLHFEIHPGGGAAINPYPILKAAEG